MCFMSRAGPCYFEHMDDPVVHPSLQPSSLDRPRNASPEAAIARFLGQIFGVVKSRPGDPASALLPWVCDRLRSEHSRRGYARDLTQFVRHMAALGIEPLSVTGDDLRVYKAALLQAGRSPASVARTLSVLRGTYQQFGKRGLVDWERVRDIQSVESPRVEKGGTPALSQREAVDILHAPDRTTLVGLRDHAMLFVFFKTACRVSAVAGSLVGHVERTDTDYYLAVSEKGGRKQRKALLDAAGALLAYMDAAGISDDLDGPLFRPVSKDRSGFDRRPLPRTTIWLLVKQYARAAGIHVDRTGGRGIGVHSLRKTALTNALENGAPIEKVQALAGHADIRTTRLYYRESARDAEDAARHIHIR